jgi:hypothetical protein
MITNSKQSSCEVVIPGIRKAAILLVMLGDLASADIIKQLPEDPSSDALAKRLSTMQVSYRWIFIEAKTTKMEPADPARKDAAPKQVWSDVRCWLAPALTPFGPKLRRRHSGQLRQLLFKRSHSAVTSTDAASIR